MIQYDWQKLLEQMLQAQSGRDVVLRTEQAPQQDDSSKQSSQKTMQNVLDQYMESTKAPSSTSSGTVPTQGGPAAGVGGTGEFYSGLGSMGTESGISGGLGGGGQFSGGMGAGAGGAGGGGAGGGGAGGMAAAAPIAYIAAAIGAQLAASNNTDTVVDGQKTGNVFTGIGHGTWNPSFSTEPWLAFGHDKLGWDATSGEKLDAAINNSDWSTALKRLPAAADYWADPIRNWLGADTWSNVGEQITGSEDFGKVLGTVIEPISGLLSQIEDWF